MTVKKGGRPAGWKIDPVPLRQRMKVLAWTIERTSLMARRQGETLSASAIRQALRRSSTSTETVYVLGTVLGLTPREFVIDATYPAEEAKRIERRIGHPRPRIRTNHKPGILSSEVSRPQQDVKNVLVSATISERLLEAKSPPSLLEAVRSTVLFPSLNDAHKDTPFAPNMDYNHFIQLGVVLMIQEAGEAAPLVVGYNRSPGLNPVSYVHTQGLSILCTTGFVHGLGHMADLDMHEWIHQASTSPEEGERILLGGDDPSLLRLLAHRLDLTGRQYTLEPLGIVTNDQRHAAGNSGGGGDNRRVYTQYVFRLTVKLPDATNDLPSILRSIVLPPEEPVALRLDGAMESCLVDPHGRANLMDVLAWRALLDNANHHRESSTTFMRRFEVV